ncbi:hypothetical protein GIB67_001397 [Kingdonia uniflora]|uniref:Uncharacterized protein n=1 Tax=Kingdonia uniflora TaxID=39325 RepID=A0A7J7N765_9MAGN|nr:hypothetical protein GIB67_001397 [Kingdonia uniflora]
MTIESDNVPNKKINEMRNFDMSELKANLPLKRGLSKCYSGKSRSFTCMADVKSVEDLKKQENPDAKKRKKHKDRQGTNVPPMMHCRRVSSSAQFASPYIGF